MSIPELSLGNMRKAIASKTPIRKDGKSFINVYVRTIKNMTSAEKENRVEYIICIKGGTLHYPKYI